MGGWWVGGRGWRWWGGGGGQCHAAPFTQLPAPGPAPGRTAARRRDLPTAGAQRPPIHVSQQRRSSTPGPRCGDRAQGTTRKLRGQLQLLTCITSLSWSANAALRLRSMPIFMVAVDEGQVPQLPCRQRRRGAWRGHIGGLVRWHRAGGRATQPWRMRGRVRRGACARGPPAAAASPPHSPLPPRPRRRRRQSSRAARRPALYPPIRWSWPRGPGRGGGGGGEGGVQDGGCVRERSKQSGRAARRPAPRQPPPPPSSPASLLIRGGVGQSGCTASVAHCRVPVCTGNARRAPAGRALPRASPPPAALELPWLATACPARAWPPAPFLPRKPPPTGARWPAQTASQFGRSRPPAAPAGRPSYWWFPPSVGVGGGRGGGGRAGSRGCCLLQAGRQAG